MTIGNLAKVPNSDRVTRTVTYEVGVNINASWQALVLLFALNDQLVSWQFKNPDDLWKFQQLEVQDQQAIHHQLLDQDLLKKAK